MRNSLAQRRSRPHGSLAVRKSTICIVDPALDDYQGWRELAQVSGVGLHFATTAHQALRLAREQSIDLWVVNTMLPDLSGCELCALIKGLSANAPVYMIADEYDPSAERAAWQVRASVFGCKGAHTAWLEEWLKAISGTTIRL